MASRNIIVMGASAGGVEALIQVVTALPADLPAAVFIVLHVPANGKSALPHILQRNTSMIVQHAEDGHKVERGHIYVAPPAKHLLLRQGRMYLTMGSKENGVRPSVDPLFRTAASEYGPRVIGVILTGTLDDGTAGLLAVKSFHGIAVVQDPDDADYSGMPQSAIQHVEVDHIVPLSGIGPLLVRLVREPVTDTGVNAVSDETEHDVNLEADIAEINMAAIREEKPGQPSEFGCPDCGGILWEMQDGKLLRYRCRTGHAYSPESLMARQANGIEDALWAALRALEERASMSGRMAQRAQENGQLTIVGVFKEQSQSAHKDAELIRSVLVRGESTFSAETVSGAVNPDRQ